MSRLVVLVHGVVDGSGWEGVYHLLKRDGFEVIVGAESDYHSGCAPYQITSSNGCGAPDRFYQ